MHISSPHLIQVSYLIWKLDYIIRFILEIILYVSRPMIYIIKILGFRISSGLVYTDFSIHNITHHFPSCKKTPKNNNNKKTHHAPQKTNKKTKF